jgi:hypothetical protein
MGADEKQCTKCGETRSLTEFHRDKKGRNGLSARCKQCASANGKKWASENRQYLRDYRNKYRESHAEETREYMRRWASENKDKTRGYRKRAAVRLSVSKRAWESRNRERTRECKRAWALRNADKVREKHRRYRTENPEKERLRHEKYHRENREKIRAASARYYAENKEKCLAATARWRRKRVREDPVTRARVLVASGIHRGLNKNGAVKNSKTFDALPYTPQELKDHLISTMPDGYTAQDWLDGKLHIDHIIPHSAFPYTSMDCELFRACWALENLRLIPASQNMRKSNLIEHKTKRGVVYYKCIFATTRETSTNENLRALPKEASQRHV